jgi:hypothetical protein
LYCDAFLGSLPDFFAVCMIFASAGSEGPTQFPETRVAARGDVVRETWDRILVLLAFFSGQ